MIIGVLQEAKACKMEFNVLENNVLWDALVHVRAKP